MTHIYFIERKDNNLWWFKSDEPLSEECDCPKCNPKMLPKRYKDGWTNDPHKAYQFKSEKDAQNAIWFCWTNEPEDLLSVTEHEFVSDGKN
jgi:hypothetical protein